MAFNGCKLPRTGSWYQAASEIGVTPEAFYRELARRRQLQLISRKTLDVRKRDSVDRVGDEYHAANAT
jgi:hypothetical protein